MLLLIILDGASTKDQPQRDAKKDPPQGDPGDNDSGSLDACEFSLEEELLFARRLEEGYDLFDQRYETWLKINHLTEHSTGAPLQPSVVTLSPQQIPSSLSSSMVTPSQQSSPVVTPPQQSSVVTPLSSPVVITPQQSSVVTPSSSPLSSPVVTSPHQSSVVTPLPSLSTPVVTPLQQSCVSVVTPLHQPDQSITPPPIISLSPTLSHPNQLLVITPPPPVRVVSKQPPNNLERSPLSDLFNLPIQKGPKPKTGHARVLTSVECLAMLKEKEEKKRLEAEEKEKRREERLLKRKQKEEAQLKKEEKIWKAAEREEKRKRMEEEKVHKATERAKKLAAKSKAVANKQAPENTKRSAPQGSSDSANGRSVRKKLRLDVDTDIYTDLCCVCFGSFEEDEGTGRNWLKCSCERWIHEDCVVANSSDSDKLCPIC